MFVLCADNDRVMTQLFFVSKLTAFLKNFHIHPLFSLQLCHHSLTALSPQQALSQAKQRISELIWAEQAVKTINEQYISRLSQADMDEISALQRQLTVRISLERGGWDKQHSICLEGLTSDVLAAEAEVRSASQLQSQQGEENDQNFLKTFLTYFFFLFVAGCSCWLLGG